MDLRSPGAPVRIHHTLNLLMRFAIVCSILTITTSITNAKAQILWQPWSEAAFSQAKAEHKLILLDLEAVWCHWCHVMDEVTYQDDKIIKLMNDHVIALKVDQDSRPDLSNRYEDYGWPATILYASDGTELAKRSGYLAPNLMSAMLEAFIADPTPGPSAGAETAITYATTSALPPSLQRELEAKQEDFYDPINAGWGIGHKYLEWTSAEYLLSQAQMGVPGADTKLLATLTASRHLLDPAWGGVYQYSVGGTWTEPHYEKIMQYQAEIMRIYALAYAQRHDPADLASAKQISMFVTRFLTSPDGGFYTSMDADLKPGEKADDFFKLNDEQRLKRGVPTLDKHRYSRENGWMIEALATLYGVSGDQSVLTAARRAAAWVSSNRALPGGGFRHDDGDTPGGPYLSDTLAMGRALLNLYLVTGDRQDLAASEAAAKFIATTFPSPEGAGYVTNKALSGDGKPSKPNHDEMVSLARYANLLGQITGDPAPKQMVTTAMRFLATPEVARRGPTAGVLLAVAETSHDPTHITIVGAKTDPQAAALFQAALSYPSAYKRVEWWDRTEGQLRHQDVDYPQTKAAAAFACTGNRCSLPISDPKVLVTKVLALNHQGASISKPPR